MSAGDVPAAVRPCVPVLATPGGSPPSPEGPWAVIRVQDTGIGIAAERMEHIWRPFEQADAGYTRPHEGTGLGLTISRSLARLMGGDLVAHSEPGAGSTFFLVLPTAKAGRARMPDRRGRERHGQNRARSGWNRAELKRDYEILREELERAVRRRAERPFSRLSAFQRPFFDPRGSTGRPRRRRTWELGSVSLSPAALWRRTADGSGRRALWAAGAPSSSHFRPRQDRRNEQAAEADGPQKEMILAPTAPA